MHHNEASLRAPARGPRGALAAIAGVAALALAAGAPQTALAHESGGMQAGKAASSSSAKAAKKARKASRSARRATLKAVQRRLGVVADGVMGRKTRRAIKRFQRRNGLAVDGVVGPATLEALGIERSSRSSSRRAPADVAELLERIAECESGGDPTAVSPDGRYRGKYQFLRSTWRSLGGTGDPAEAPEAEQDERAAVLMERQGPSAWPHCSRQ